VEPLISLITTYSLPIDRLSFAIRLEISQLFASIPGAKPLATLLELSSATHVRSDDILTPFKFVSRPLVPFLQTFSSRIAAWR